MSDDVRAIQGYVEKLAVLIDISTVVVCFWCFAIVLLLQDAIKRLNWLQANTARLLRRTKLQ